MTNKRPLLKIFLFSFLLISTLSCKDEERDLEEQDPMLDSLSRELAQYKRTSDSLKALLEKSDLATGYPIFYGRKFDSIENPAEFISEELKKHPNKIPLEPVLGGTMEFRKVQVLTEDWVLAIYDDGHIQGKSIYKYELQPDGSLKFDLVASRLPE